MEQKTTKTSKDILSPKKVDIPFNSVKLSKSWALWETYSSKTEELSYEASNKQIFK